MPLSCCGDEGRLRGRQRECNRGGVWGVARGQAGRASYGDRVGGVGAEPDQQHQWCVDHARGGQLDRFAGLTGDAEVRQQRPPLAAIGIGHFACRFAHLSALLTGVDADDHHIGSSLGGGGAAKGVGGHRSMLVLSALGSCHE